MSNLRSLGTLLVILGLSACGGGGSSSASAGQTSGSGGEHHERPRIAEIDALHDEIAPVFHAEPGAVRIAAACEHASALGERSSAVRAVASPASVDAAEWDRATAQLVGAAEGLAAECASSGPAVEERLSTLHDAFHHVMELGTGEHHDEHHGS